MTAAYGSARSTFERLLTIQSDECVLWPYGRWPNGYARARIDGVDSLLHRVACERRYGPPPKGKAIAAHACRNRHCINPRHLRWATQSENMADKIGDGTATRGTRHPGAVLSEGDVLEIRRQLAESGRRQWEIAADFGVAHQTISAIKCNDRWGWLDSPQSSGSAG